MIEKAKSWAYENRAGVFLVILGLVQMAERYSWPSGILCIAVGGYHLLRGDK